MLTDNVASIGDAVNGLAVINLGQMVRAAAQGKPLPSLASGLIRYARERPNRERWQTAEEVARRGMGDCEDLSAYFVAEARAKGIAASAFATLVQNGLIHIRVRMPDDSIVDPSAQLGMKGAA